MRRRASLPGASELFRTTRGAPGEETSTVEPAGGPGAEDTEATEGPSAATPRRGSPAKNPAKDAAPKDASKGAKNPASNPASNLAPNSASSKPATSKRERHDEKITVYVSGEELLALEAARLQLRAAHGLGVDRGRIVREALAVVLGEFDATGADSTLVRRLHQE